MPKGSDDFVKTDKQLEPISLWNEIIDEKRKKLSEIQLAIHQAGLELESARARWTDEKKHGESLLRQELDNEKNKLLIRENEVNQLAQRLEYQFRVVEDMKKEGELFHGKLAEKEKELSDLSRQRMEVHQLRQEAIALKEEAQIKMSKAAQDLNAADIEINKAAEIKKDCDAKYKEVIGKWEELKRWQEELTLQERNLKFMTDEFNKRFQTQETANV